MINLFWLIFKCQGQKRDIPDYDGSLRKILGKNMHGSRVHANKKQSWGNDGAERKLSLLLETTKEKGGKLITQIAHVCVGKREQNETDATPLLCWHRVAQNQKLHHGLHWWVIKRVADRAWMAPQWEKHRSTEGSEGAMAIRREASLARRGA